MYAVIKTGGKQYRVKQGDTLKLESLNASEGEAVEFTQVLMVGEGDQVKIGTPFLAGGKVTAKVMSNGRHPKIEVVKFRRRKHFDRRTGHRQNFTEVEITGING